MNSADGRPRYALAPFDSKMGLWVVVDRGRRVTGPASALACSRCIRYLREDRLPEAAAQRLAFAPGEPSSGT